jgi:hypothetical protein
MSATPKKSRWTLPYVLAALLLLMVPVSAGADDEYQFSAPVFEIEATANGSILVAEHTTIKEIHRGSVSTVGEIDSITSIQGLVADGRGSIYAATGALDLAEGAAVYHVSRGGVKMVADIEAFETAEDPDAALWKVPECEAIADENFSAGPQSNPYHMVGLTGSSQLVADAAGNTLLQTHNNGRVDLVATFTPPVDGNGDYRVLIPGTDFDCYVQPVPTAVDVGSDGAYYVGELTGVPAVPGWSRVWRVEAGANDVVCPSADCVEVISDLTSVIDVAFGPDGLLYVVEYDVNGWLAVFLGNAAGGAIQACDVTTGDCETVADGLELPGAITFDKWGNLWLLESNIANPTVRKLDLP